MLTLLAGYVFGVVGNSVYAQDVGNSPSYTPQFETKMTSSINLAEQASKFLTLLLWPLVTVAGIAMDNQLVYGSTIGFDTSLRKVRNIAKNIANFALGFIFLFYLFNCLIKKGGDTKEIVGIVKKILISGILIQASRFITAAAVDISTIATYGVGGIPLSVMDNPEHNSKYVL